jgi:uncharacterized protein (DUF934 family)
MLLIKNKQIVENDYHFFADDESPVTGNAIVSFTRWQAEKTQLQATTDKIGVCVTVEDDLISLTDDLASLSVIAFHFAAFTDGRSFSRAKLLKERLGYHGEIRAVGHFMVDQVCYLAKVGFHSFQLENEAQLSVALKTLDDFSFSYQV